MTIDAYDWAHRTGDNPPDASTADPCTSRPARPNLYEGTFAHEWQHLLHHYTDPLETNWVNEGLSDFAQTLVGYVDATTTVDQPGADSHIYCFQGFGTVQTPYNPNPRDCGGAAELADPVGRGRQPGRGPGRLRQRLLVDALPLRPVRHRLHVGVAPRRRPPGHRQPRRPAQGRGRLRRLHGDPRVPVDGAAGQDRRRRQALDRARRPQGRRHHAEPALDGQPGQPGVLQQPRRRPQRRRLRRAPRRRRQGAARQQAAGR